jgi:transposase-like protein
LSDQSSHSKAKLYRIIDYWLAKDPGTKENLEQYQFLIFDGTFFQGRISLLALMDARTNTIICGNYGAEENSESQVFTFFNNLKAKGLNPVSFTVDGNPQVINVLRNIWPNIIIQRCLVHIQRQGFMWCRAKPNQTYARKLRAIFAQVTHIRTKQERDCFLGMVNEWEEKYGQYVKPYRESGRVFSDIKRARSMLMKALPDMFHYLDSSSTSFTTNSLEGYFSRLKLRYRQHRGLPRKKLGKYLDWYLFLAPK